MTQQYQQLKTSFSKFDWCTNSVCILTSYNQSEQSACCFLYHLICMKPPSALCSSLFEEPYVTICFKRFRCLLKRIIWSCLSYFSNLEAVVSQYQIPRWQHNLVMVCPRHLALIRLDTFYRQQRPDIIVGDKMERSWRMRWCDEECPH